MPGMAMTMPLGGLPWLTRCTPGLRAGPPALLPAALAHPPAVQLRRGPGKARAVGADLAVRQDGTVAGRFGYRSLTGLEWVSIGGLTLLAVAACWRLRTWPSARWKQAVALVALLATFTAGVRQARCRPELKPPREVLPLKASCLALASGVTVHYLRRRRERAPRLAVCFHGFGASALSWERGWVSLGKKLNAEVLAFDAPGFGLTERPPLPLKNEALDSSPYRCGTSAEIARALVRIHGRQKPDPGGCDLVLLGHSLGAISASLTALALPPGEQARTSLVLESPAIFAPAAGGRKAGPAPGPPRLSPPAWRLWPIVALLPWVLRRLVYRRRFWERGLGLAGGADERLLTHYRWPSLVQNWDKGLARFVATRLHGELEEADIVERLATARRDNGLRVLLVHGEGDSIVPVSNSERLAEALGAKLVRVPDCGHVAHEQAPEAFAAAAAGGIGLRGRGPAGGRAGAEGGKSEPKKLGDLSELG
uniref:AB hydrolase-1 domain-containing protein n=1 Tax=Alexandrium monilatum TaxID=311494 RepID=A0A7S4Q291_9DINO